MQQVIGALLAALAMLALASVLERWHEITGQRLGGLLRSALEWPRHSPGEILLGTVAVAAVASLLMPFGIGLRQEILVLEVVALLFGMPKLLRALMSIGSSAGRGR